MSSYHDHGQCMDVYLPSGHIKALRVSDIGFPISEDQLEKLLVGHTQAKKLETVKLLEDRRGDVIRKIMARCLWADHGSPYGPCLEWQGPDSGKPGRGRAKGRGHSYARMNMDGVTAAVHRVVWVTLNGYLPSKRQLDHLCNNRKCVLHCEPVTHKENQRRRDAKRSVLA